MSIYEEVEIEDLDFDPEKLIYTYPCPCGDKFRISLADLWDGEDVAPCPSCTLRIEIIYEEEDLPPLPEGYEDYGSDYDDDEEEPEEDVTATNGGKNTSDTLTQDKGLTDAVKNLSI